MAIRAQQPKSERIINNGSVSGHTPRPVSMPCTISKHTIASLTKNLLLDGRLFDGRASQIDIGNALTAMAQKIAVGIPQADGSVWAEAVKDASHVANAVLHTRSVPLDANLQFMTVMTSKMPFIGRG